MAPLVVLFISLESSLMSRGTPSSIHNVSTYSGEVIGLRPISHRHIPQNEKYHGEVETSSKSKH
jgi:hypothetical protein